MSQPGTPSRVVLPLLWLVVGSAMIGVPMWLGWSRWEPILAGNPATLIVLIACSLAGVVALAWALASLILGSRLNRDEQYSPASSGSAHRRRARRQIVLAVPALLICVVVVVTLALTRPLPATAAGIAASRSSAGVRASDRLTWYELSPTGRGPDGKPRKPKVGLVFLPAARVDPRAYAPLLAPIAKAGYLVIVLKEPLGLAVLDPGHAWRPIGVHPEITYWVVGGHSLGGIRAAAFADSSQRIKGLVLWASYPAGALGRSDLRVLSVFGSADARTTPADIRAHQADLPRNTEYVEVPGGTRAAFGEYEDGAGDGIPGTPGASAERRVVTATHAFLTTFQPAQPKKAEKK